VAYGNAAAGGEHDQVGASLVAREVRGKNAAGVGAVLKSRSDRWIDTHDDAVVDGSA
jgi:hypothetical protein